MNYAIFVVVQMHLNFFVVKISIFLNLNIVIWKNEQYIYFLKAQT